MSYLKREQKRTNAENASKQIFNEGKHSLNHGRVFSPFPDRPHPLVHHDACVSVHQHAQEEEDDRGHYHHTHGVQLVVLRQAGAVKVEAGVQFDADQRQNDADTVGDGLGVGLEILEDQLHSVHGGPLDSSRVWETKKIFS